MMKSGFRAVRFVAVLAVVLVTAVLLSVNVFAEDIFGEGNNSTTTITGNEYADAQNNTADNTSNK